MKKHFLMLGALLALSMQTALAAPSGWYNLNLSWGGNNAFTGKVFYDPAAYAPITQVTGQLTTDVRTTGTAITQVFFDNEELDPLANDKWSFLANNDAALLLGYDAGFYLSVTDATTAPAIDLAGDNSLYDFSTEDEFGTPGISGLALQNGSITAISPVPEPSMLAMSLVGLAGIAALRRRRRA